MGTAFSDLDIGGVKRRGLNSGGLVTGHEPGAADVKRNIPIPGFIEQTRNGVNFSCPQPAVHLRQFLPELVSVTLNQATRHIEFPQLARSFQIRDFEYRAHRLFYG